MHHNPSLDRRRDEAAIVGRMVVGFGEVEFKVVSLAFIAHQHLPAIFRALYQLRSTSARIEAAFTLVEPSFKADDRKEKLDIARKAVDYCIQVRNIYAHCNWGDDDGGLFYTDVQDSVERDDFSHDWKHVDVGILSAQENFFGYTRHWLFHLEHELKVNPGLKLHLPSEAPAIQPPPPKHNPASQHIPRWLSADEKARHSARALEAERPLSQPGRPPSIPKLTQEEWLAKLRKEGWTLPVPPNQASE